MNIKEHYFTTILSLSVSSNYKQKPIDPRSYETFLNNGIEVITISDANLAVSANLVSA